MKIFLWLGLFLMLSLPLKLIAVNNYANREILDLKYSISEKMSDNVQLHEKYYKHKLAQQQAKLIILTATNFIYNYYRGKRSYKQIDEFVRYAYECSFIFPTLGRNNLDVFVTYLRWAEAETDYNPNAIDIWKKGQRIRGIKLNKRGRPVRFVIVIRFDSEDYGILQVNNKNLRTLRRSINNLYEEGVIPFKVKRLNSAEDLLDIRTNLVARSIIEVDRKKHGLEWQHWTYNTIDFYARLRSEIYEMRLEGLYNIYFVQKYYNLIPVKQYRG